MDILSLLTSVRFDSYKSFDENGPFRLPLGQNITLIIGRNNSGKSSLIDIIEGVISIPKRIPEGVINVCPSFIIDEEHVKSGFGEDRRSLQYYVNDYQYARNFLGREITLKCVSDKFLPAEEQEDSVVYIEKSDIRNTSANWENCARRYRQDIINAKFLRINAERDVIPENESDAIVVDENGNGATNLIRKYIGYSREMGG